MNSLNQSLHYLAFQFKFREDARSNKKPGLTTNTSFAVNPGFLKPEDGGSPLLIGLAYHFPRAGYCQRYFESFTKGLSAGTEKKATSHFSEQMKTTANHHLSAFL